MEWSEWTQRISTPDLLFFFGVLLAVFTMMRFARKRAMRRVEEPRPAIDRAAMLAALRAPVEDDEPAAPREAPASSAPNSATLELLQRLDNRIRTLEELLRAADRKIVELNGLLQQSPSLRPSTAHTTPAHHQAEALSRAREFPRTLRSPETAAPAGRTTARYQAVYRLLDQGETASSVAKKLGYPIGEVELIASLRG